MDMLRDHLHRAICARHVRAWRPQTPGSQKQECTLAMTGANMHSPASSAGWPRASSSASSLLSVSTRSSSTSEAPTLGLGPIQRLHQHVQLAHRQRIEVPPHRARQPAPLLPRPRPPARLALPLPPLLLLLPRRPPDRRPHRPAARAAGGSRRSRAPATGCSAPAARCRCRG